MEDVERVFNKFDTNGDGKIDLSELRSILVALGSDATPKAIESIMSEIDIDGDGFIDLKEFTSFHLGGSGDDSDVNNGLRGAFEFYDQDKNGLISASGLHTALKSLGEKCTLHDCQRMISAVDVDGDGSVNFEEFKTLMNNKNRLETSQDIFEDELKSNTSDKDSGTGKLMLNAARAILEPMLSLHFGNNVMDKLFERYAVNQAEYLATNTTKVFNIVISLTRKSDY